MPEYVASVLYVFTQEGTQFVEPLRKNVLGVDVTPVAYETLQQNSANILKEADHVVISGNMTFLKEMIRFSLEHDFSIGLIPLPDQKDLSRVFALPATIDGLIDLALRKDAIKKDLTLCNEKILLFKASIGRIPLIDRPATTKQLYIFWDTLKMLWSLRLLPFTFSIADEQKTDIHTAACGCMILGGYRQGLASRLIASHSSFVDGMISLFIAAPISVVDYIKFVFHILFRPETDTSIPASTGYIKCSEITIKTEEPLPVDIDGEHAATTPLHCRILPGAVRINIGEESYASRREAEKGKGQIHVKSLPAGKELIKARNRTIPFFAYASENRFRDLFSALRDDASLNPIYFVLMTLSTIIATTGLYLNSSSVIIGAMLLAPLMAPIVSLAMGLLRKDDPLIKRSIGKIGLGIVLALMIAALITMLFPNIPVTGEMLSRLQPTILDLIVAITAGVAGAYTKSHKEILESLAGVAIAVALVPPLAVAGIGLGRLDIEFFSQAFLLFSTNLVGITLAATFTFRLLGYSPAVRSKHGIGIVFLLLILITIPLFLASKKIINTRKFEQSWKEERFLVHGKYIIIHNAQLSEIRDRNILSVDIFAREPLTRSDLAELKRKISYNFSEDLIIRANISYIQ